MTEFLQREVQSFLRLAQPPAATSRFLDLGTDSLMAVELRNRLHSQFGGAFTINATAVFDYPTIGGLAEYLAISCPSSSRSRVRSRAERNPSVHPSPHDAGRNRFRVLERSRQSAISNPVMTLVGCTRTTSSPGTALRRPNCSARSAPM